MASLSAQMWRRLGLREATPARALEAAARSLHESCRPRWTAAVLLAEHGAPEVVAFAGEGPPPAILEEARSMALRDPTEVSAGVFAAGLWPHGALGGALIAA